MSEEEVGALVDGASRAQNIVMQEAAPVVTPVFPAAIALADIVEPQPAAQESNSLAYSGAAFGVIAVLAAGAIYKSCRTRKTYSNEESLL